jgi:phosphopantetheinyl transferase (holo-ACP synthase)
LDVDPQRRIATLWALKEAVYKASNAGEAFVPRQVEIVPQGSDGFRCLYRGLPLASVSLAVRDLDDHVAAVVEISLVPTHGRSNIATLSQAEATFRKPS